MSPRVWVRYGVPVVTGALLGGCARSIERSVELVADGRMGVTTVGRPCRVELHNLGPGELSFTPEIRSWEGGDWQAEAPGLIGPGSSAVIGRSHDLRVELNSPRGTTVRVKARASDSVTVTTTPAGV